MIPRSKSISVPTTSKVRTMNEVKDIGPLAGRREKTIAAWAVGGGDSQPDRPAVAYHLQQDLGAGPPARPDLAVEVGQTLHTFVTHRGDDIPRLHARRGGWALIREIGDNHLAASLRGVDAEPGARRLVHPAMGQHFLQHRRQEIDGHHHVDVALPALDHLAQMERADAEKLAVPADEAGASPMGVGGGGEDRLLQEIFPVARELFLADDLGAERLA